MGRLRALDPGACRVDAAGVERVKRRGKRHALIATARTLGLDCPSGALRERAMHSIEDFYSHSNLTDLPNRRVTFSVTNPPGLRGAFRAQVPTPMLRSNLLRLQRLKHATALLGVVAAIAAARSARP